MKGKKEVKQTHSPYDLEGSLDEAIETLSKWGDGLEDVKLSWGYYDEWEVTGYRDMTPKEKETARKASQRAKEAAQRRRERQETADRELLAKLKAKYE